MEATPEEYVIGLNTTGINQNNLTTEVRHLMV